MRKIIFGVLLTFIFTNSVYASDEAVVTLQNTEHQRITVPKSNESFLNTKINVNGEVINEDYSDFSSLYSDKEDIDNKFEKGFRNFIDNTVIENKINRFQ